MRKLYFDQSNLVWRNDGVTNGYWLRLTINWIQEKLRARGYMYLNEIYETLGFKWNPDEENICYRDGTWIDIAFKPANETDYVITIN